MLAAEQRSASEFAERVAPAAVRGALDGQPVVLVTSGADPADRDAVVALLGQAGAHVTGEVELTEAVGDPARAGQLRELTAQLLPSGAQLPAASDTGSLAGGLLGGVLLTVNGQPQTTPDEARAVLTGLAAAGFVRPGEPPAPANLALVLTGGARTGIDAGDAAAVVARLAAQLDRAGGGCGARRPRGRRRGDRSRRRRAGRPRGRRGSVHRGRRAHRVRAGVDGARPAPAARRTVGQLRLGGQRGRRRRPRPSRGVSPPRQGRQRVP